MNNQEQSNRERLLTSEQAALLDSIDRLTASAECAYNVAEKAQEAFHAARNAAEKASIEVFNARQTFIHTVLPKSRTPGETRF